MITTKFGPSVKIVQIIPTPNDDHWGGCVLGLGSDGVVYMSDHVRNESGWIVYVKDVLIE